MNIIKIRCKNKTNNSTKNRLPKIGRYYVLRYYVLG